MLADQAAVTLTRIYQNRLLAVGDRTGAAAARAWDELGSYDRSDISRFARTTGPAVSGSKTAAVRLATGYYSTLLGLPAPAIAVQAIPVAFDVQAGFLALWHALKEGRSYTEAVTAGRSMTEAAATNSVVSASRRTGDAFIEASGQSIAGWRRVLDGKACPWCQLVSTQRYKTAESADFGHDRCGCTPVPIIGDRDPGRVINRELLKKLKAEGVVDDISRQQALPRALEVQRNAQTRVEKLRAELAKETDQERETRLERRLEKAKADLVTRNANVDRLQGR